MSSLGSWILSQFEGLGPAICYRSERVCFSYAALATRILASMRLIRKHGVGKGEVIALDRDDSFETIAFFFALICLDIIVVPLEPDGDSGEQRCQIAGATGLFTVEKGTIRFQRLARQAPQPLVKQLQEQEEAGIILFSSGSTGAPKASLLVASRLLARFRDATRKPMKTLVFLKPDHIGGINTLFSVLFNGGTVVAVSKRDPESVCRAIAQHQVEFLPTTPTFLNMLLLSGFHQEFDLNSLRLITYGTEPMPPSTLQACADAFPKVKLKQTYGLTELGIMSSRGRRDGSTWMQLGGAGLEWKIVEGILWLRSPAAMMGYLNAPCPFDADGWYCTGDRVESDGPFVRILGRDQELINVGGEKVFPTEVESVLLEVSGVQEAMVSGRKNPVTGQVVQAQIVVGNADPQEMREKILAHCRNRLERFKIPVLLRFCTESLMGSRFKLRRQAHE